MVAPNTFIACGWWKHISLNKSSDMLTQQCVSLAQSPVIPSNRHTVTPSLVIPSLRHPVTPSLHHPSHRQSITQSLRHTVSPLPRVTYVSTYLLTHSLTYLITFLIIYLLNYLIHTYLLTHLLNYLLNYLNTLSLTARVPRSARARASLSVNWLTVVHAVR